MRPRFAFPALAGLGWLLAALGMPAGPGAPPDPVADGPALVLLWPEPDRRHQATAWPGPFSVTNRGRAASGPVHLTVRTPLGISHAADLAGNLLPGEAATHDIALALEPGMTELCLEVRGAPGVRSPAELDLTDNRVCRRPKQAELPISTAQKGPEENRR